MNDGGGGSYPPGLDTGRGRGRGVNTTAGRGGQIFKVHGGDVARLVASEPGTGVTRLSCTHYTGVTRDCQPLFLKIVKKFFLFIYVWPNCIYRIYTVSERLQVDVSADTGDGKKRRLDSTDGGDGGGI